MYQMLVLLIALVQLGHAAAGCCWHHAHSSVADCCSSPEPSSSSCHCTSHANHQVSHKSRSRNTAGGVQRPEKLEHAFGLETYTKPARNEEKPAKPCCDSDRCKFVRSESSPQQTGELNSSFYFPVPVAYSLSMVEQRRSARLAGEYLISADGCSSLRAHLLLGVLLV